MNNKKGNLYLIPTVLAPDSIENSINHKIKRIVKDTNIFMVENVRSARRFISSLRLDKVIDEITFIQLDKNSSLEDIYEQMIPLDHGTNIGILSESGCPGIADPGSMAVGLAHEKGICVIPLVGPSSILLSLMASGFNGQQFTFHGYLPIEKSSRKNAIRNLEKELVRTGYTQIFIETPYRNDKLLAELTSTLNPKTRVCVAADLTSKDEYIKTQPVEKWRREKVHIGKVPAIFLMGL